MELVQALQFIQSRAGRTQPYPSTVSVDKQTTSARPPTSMYMLTRQYGHFDIPRARKGKMGGFFWSMSASSFSVKPQST